MPVGGGSFSTQSARVPFESVCCISNAAPGSVFRTSASSCTSPNAPRVRLSPSSSCSPTTLPVSVSIFFCASSIVERRCITLTNVSLVLRKPSSSRSLTRLEIWSRRASSFEETASRSSPMFAASRSLWRASPSCRSASTWRCFSSSVRCTRNSIQTAAARATSEATSTASAMRDSRAKKERAPGGALEEHAAAGTNFLCAVRRLAVRGHVEPLALLILGYAQADRQVDHLVRDRRDDAGPQDRDADRLRLRPDLRADALEAGLHLEPVVRETGTPERRIVEHACQQRAEDPADGVHAEDVERVVD